MLDARQKLIADDFLRSSEAIRRSHFLTELFKYLCERYPEYSPTALLWENVLKPAGSKSNNWAVTVRNCCDDVTKALNAYFTTTHHLWEWRFDLPDAVRRRGYRLEPIAQNNGPAVTFWRPHLEQRAVTLVYAQPLFYLDMRPQAYIRFLDTNTHSGSWEEAYADLEKRHPKELQQWYGTPQTAKLQPDQLQAFYRDVVRPKLRPAHNFVATGEMHALDTLMSWFRNYPFVAVEKIPNESINTHKGIPSPILIGSHRTNKFIAQFLDSPEGQHFRYRLHKDMVGYLTVRHAEGLYKRVAEKAKLDGAAVSTIPSYEDKEQGFTVFPVEPIMMDADRTRFAVVTRMPKPGGSGAVTMICSDTALATEQIALALTIEGGDQGEKTPLIKHILAALGWPHAGTLPTSFEMVFSVRVATGGSEDVGEPPQLLLASSY